MNVPSAVGGLRDLCQLVPIGGCTLYEKRAYPLVPTPTLLAPGISLGLGSKFWRKSVCATADVIAGMLVCDLCGEFQASQNGVEHF